MTFKGGLSLKIKRVFVHLYFRATNYFLDNAFV